MHLGVGQYCRLVGKQGKVLQGVYFTMVAHSWSWSYWIHIFIHGWPFPVIAKSFMFGVMHWGGSIVRLEGIALGARAWGQRPNIHNDQPKVHYILWRTCGFLCMVDIMPYRTLKDMNMHSTLRDCSPLKGKINLPNNKHTSTHRRNPKLFTWVNNS